LKQEEKTFMGPECNWRVMNWKFAFQLQYNGWWRTKSNILYILKNYTCP
jgi:hypothetical protein